MYSVQIMNTVPVDLIHQKHKEYLLEHTPTDHIIEDRGITWYRGVPTSEFVISAGGDISVYQISGPSPDFKLYER